MSDDNDIAHKNMRVFSHDKVENKLFKASVFWMNDSRIHRNMKIACDDSAAKRTPHALSNQWQRALYPNFIKICNKRDDRFFLTPMMNQGRISPYNINALPSGLVISINKNINLGIISWSYIKFFKLTS